MTPVLLYNAIIINESRCFKGYLSIDADGIISHIGEGDVPAQAMQTFSGENHDLHEHWLLPGAIDSHVHFREPGLTHKADIHSESRAAVAGGVTSYMEMPNTNPATVSIETLRQKAKIAAAHSLANYSFYIGATNNNADALKAADYSAVPGIKVFMGSSTGGMLVDGNDALDEIFSLPELIAVHCEDEGIVRSNVAKMRGLYPQGAVPIEWHPEIRPALACYSSSRRAVDYALRHNSRLHILHITTAEEIELLRETPDNISGEACVAHLLFCDEDYASLGTRIKCNPSVKSRIHREALRKAVADGTISTISTDHAPHALDEKQGDALTAPSGMPMIQFSLTAMLDLATRGVFTPERVVEAMCHRQADLYHVEKRGYIRPGYHADIVEIDPMAETRVDAKSVISKCGWSPLEGRTLRTRVLRTWVNGQCVYSAQEGILGVASPARPLVFYK